MQPAAYLRRSYVDANSPGDISLNAQRAAVAALAAQDGHNGNVAEYSDWGISADVAKSARRTAYARLLADMEAGKVSAVYAFDVDRLYRDPRDLIRLQDAAQRHRVRIITTSGELAIGDGDDPASEAFAFIGSVFGSMELKKIKKRNRAAREAREARGDVFGHPGYGWKHVRDATGRIVRVPDPNQPLDPILDIVREQKGILPACRELEARGIPAPKGGTRWSTSALTRIVEQNAPELLSRKGPTGRRQPSQSRLGQLIVCYCGTVMTPNRARGQLYCHRGHIEGSAKHGQYNVREADLIEWVKAEVARFEPPAKKVQLRDSNQQRRLDLEEDRRRQGIAFTARALSDDEFAATISRIDAELEALDEVEDIIEIEPVDWEFTPAAELNAVLRSIIKVIHLDRQMRPERAVWRIPDWRRND